MSRQAGPSIVLSVLIVCFFAVALFQRDLPCTQSRRARSSVRAPGARSSVPPALGRTRSAQSEGLERSNRGIRQNEMSSPTGSDSASDTRDRMAFASPDPRTASLGLDESDIHRRHGSNSPPGRVRQASALAPGQGQATKAMASSTPRTPVSPRRPASEFTIARPEETIADVASRVYGNTNASDSLWRANRDTLPRRDSPLSSGMLLRTPMMR
jgi:hypothetical protein